MSDQLHIPFSAPSALLRQMGLRAIAFIRERTLKGIDADGNPFHPYSTTPFARPYGGITQRTKANLGDRLQVFTNPKSGKLWAVIEGGYEEYKRAAYPSDGGVNLTATGAMLRALTIVSIDEGTNTVVIGFARAEEAEKALYHDQIGAGPRRVIRHFMGVSATEKQELAAMGVAGLQIKT